MRPARSRAARLRAPALPGTPQRVRVKRQAHRLHVAHPIGPRTRPQDSIMKSTNHRLGARALVVFLAAHGAAALQATLGGATPAGWNTPGPDRLIDTVSISVSKGIDRATPMPFQAQTHSRERPESIPPQAIPDDLLWGIILGVFEFIECAAWQCFVR